MAYFKRYWAKDAEMMGLMAEAMEEVAYRALYRYHQRIGLVPFSGELDVHDSGLKDFIANNKVSVQEPEKGKDDTTGSLNIPRASRPASPELGNP
jgi:hypothetical protein